jgi:hypothetical protein
MMVAFERVTLHSPFWCALCDGVGLPYRCAMCDGFSHRFMLDLIATQVPHVQHGFLCRDAYVFVHVCSMYRSAKNW